MVNEVGKPISNAVVHVRSDTSGKDIDHDITSGEQAEYSLLSVFIANVIYFFSTCFVVDGWNVGPTISPLRYT